MAVVVLTLDAHVEHTLDVVRTQCGREITIGRIQVGFEGHPVDRVTLGIGCQSYDKGNGAVWASLTSAESRALAGKLLAQAAAADVAGYADQDMSGGTADPG